MPRPLSGRSFWGANSHVAVGGVDQRDIAHTYPRTVEKLVEDSQLCVLPGATHFVLGEKPEVVLPIVMDFFGG